MTEPLRVLLVEDSLADAKLVLAALQRGGRRIEHERVETAEDMRGALARAAWDVVISDWSLPRFNAPAALAVVRELRLDLPFIIVSGTVGEEKAVEAMRTGAHDYVLKGNLGRLLPAVMRETGEHEGRKAHRQAEVARVEAELRFRRLFDAGIIGVTITDPTGHIAEANDTFLDLVGYTRADLEAGRLSWSQMTPSAFGHLAAGVGDQLRTAGRVRPFEKEYIRKDGTHVPVLVGIAPLDATRMISVVTDLTQRNLVAQANVALEHQLRQAQKMEAIGRLAGGIAHDFNNLLSVVLSYSEMLMSDLKIGDPIRADIEEIHHAGKRAAELTSQLLMFSRQQVIAPMVLDLNELIAGLDRMLRRLVGEDIELTLVPGKNLARVRVDPGSIEQVIMNLAINARDAMPVGGKLTIETSRVELDDQYVKSHLDAKPGPYLMLAVTDTGTGMDKATLAQIFEPFFTTKEVGKGTGLGLSTVIGIVQQSAGHIWVYSEVGIGTTFKVYLPQVDAVPDVALAEHSPTHLRGSETILVVEDEQQVRDVARGILRRFGYTVIEAMTPGDALLLCEQHQGTIDLLLTDVVMPQMSGPELAKRLTKQRPAMRVLCMSGYTDDAAIRHGVVEAEIPYLQKPLTVQSLTKRVREVLNYPKWPLGGRS